MSNSRCAHCGARIIADDSHDADCEYIRSLVRAELARAEEAGDVVRAGDCRVALFCARRPGDWAHEPSIVEVRRALAAVLGGGRVDSVGERCLYCESPGQSAEVPDPFDAEAWARIELRHHPRCEWTRTRAHRAGRP